MCDLSVLGHCRSMVLRPNVDHMQQLLLSRNSTQIKTFMHPFNCHLAETRLHGQQTGQRSPELLLSICLFQLFQGYTELFPSKYRNVISAASRCMPHKPCACRRWSKHLFWEAFRKLPAEMPKPTPFDAEEQRLYFLLWERCEQKYPSEDLKIKPPWNVR